MNTLTAWILLPVAPGRTLPLVAANDHRAFGKAGAGAARKRTSRSGRNAAQARRPRPNRRRLAAMAAYHRHEPTAVPGSTIGSNFQ